MKLKNLIILFFSFTFLTGCDYYDDRLVISNNTAKNIYVAFSKDTLVSLGENLTFIMPGYFIKTKSKRNLMRMGSTKAWEFYANKSLSNQLHIFILMEDTLKKYEATEIEKMQKYEKRIDIGVQELSAKDWEVAYE
jgi:hypothetical protein